MSGELLLAAMGGVAAIVGAISGAVTVYVGRHKLLAETTKLTAEAEKLKANKVDQLADTALSLIEPLKVRITELERISATQTRQLGELSKDLDNARHLIRTLLRGVAILMHQLQRQGVEPLFVVPVTNGPKVDVEELERRLLEEIGNDHMPNMNP